MGTVIIERFGERSNQSGTGGFSAGKLYMNQALKISNNNLTKAAALLGTTRFSIKRKMEREE